MSKPENDLQITIRMPSALKRQIDKFVEDKDISSMGFIRRAITEKLERESNTIQDSEIKYMNKDIFKKYLIDAIQNDADVQNLLKNIK